MTAKTARKRMETFDPDKSPCPICGKVFVNECLHTVKQARHKLKLDYMKARGS